MDLPSPGQPLTPETRFLYALQRGKTRLGLESTRRLLRLLGSPERDVPVLHVAGTNGKGSTTAYAAALLQTAGLRVGRFTSPHVQRVEERLCVDGTSIAPDDFAALVREARPSIERAGASFFEAMTALAALYFRAEGVEAAVYEVGLGGRLDATNVLPAAVSVVTSIGNDHEDILGRGLRAICAEKLGIVRPGVPVHAALARPELKRLASEHCERVGAPLRLLPERSSRVTAMSLEGGMWFELDRCPGTPLWTAFLGQHYGENAALAFQATTEFLSRAGGSSPPDLPAAIAAAFLPGRFQVLRSANGGAPVAVDVAHNPQALRATLRTARQVFGASRPAVVLGLMRDKRVDGCAGLLAGWARDVVLTAPRVERAWDPEAAARRLRRRGLEAVVEAEVGAALERVASAPLLLLGSHFLLAEAVPWLSARCGAESQRLLAPALARTPLTAQG